jgi:thermitase
MKTHKTFFLFSIALVIVFSLNLDWLRIPKPEKNKTRYLGIKLQSLNQGKLFRQKGERYVPDEVLVKFKPSLSQTSIQVFVNAYQAKTIEKIQKYGIYKLKVAEHSSVEETVRIMEQNPDVQYVHPNYIVRITAVPKPNDTFFEYQYALFNEGQDIGIPGSPHGKNRADIKALEAWDETKGTQEIVIAVIDTGIDFNHPDLTNKIAQNGYDFVNDDTDPTDDEGHGTFVASVAAAETNNGEGIAGVAWNCSILPIKAIGEDGTGDYFDLVDSVYYAIDNGADVINMSLGIPLSSGEIAPELELALQIAHSNGIISVAAAGNASDSVEYPAAFDNYCLAVAATDYNDARTTWSNFGPEVDVAAPGDRIVGCVPLWYWGEGSLPYAFGNGTSASVPHVVGMVALIKSIKPWLTADNIMDIIRFSADDTNSSEYPGKDEFIGYGRINMEKALVPLIITK